MGTQLDSDNSCSKAQQVEFLSIFRKGQIHSTFDLNKRTLHRSTYTLDDCVGVEEESRAWHYPSSNLDGLDISYLFYDEIWSATHLKLKGQRPLLTFGPLRSSIEIDALIWALGSLQQQSFSAHAQLKLAKKHEAEKRRQRTDRLRRFDEMRRRYKFPLLSAPNVTFIGSGPEFVRGKPRKTSADLTYVSGGVSRSWHAIGPIAFEFQVFCAQIELQFRAGASPKIIQFGTAIQRTMDGVNEIETPAPIKAFIKANLSLGRLFEPDHISDMLSDERFLLGNAARKAEQLSKLRKKLAAPGEIDTSAREAAKLHIERLQYARSQLLAKASKKAAIESMLIDKWMMNSQDDNEQA